MTTQLSQKEINELLELKAKVKVDKDKRTGYNMFRNAIRQLIINKAIAKGITVSDKEVQAWLKDHPSK